MSSPSIFGISLITVTKRFSTTRTFFLISRESLLSTRLKSSRSKTRRLQALLGGDSSTFDLHSLLGQVLPQVVVVFVSHKNMNTHQNSHYTFGTKLGALLRRCPVPWTRGLGRFHFTSFAPSVLTSAANSFFHEYQFLPSKNRKGDDSSVSIKFY